MLLQVLIVDRRANEIEKTKVQTSWFCEEQQLPEEALVKKQPPSPGI
jgi:hypothetical protein